MHRGSHAATTIPMTTKQFQIIAKERKNQTKTLIENAGYRRKNELNYTQTPNTFYMNPVTIVYDMSFMIKKRKKQMSVYYSRIHLFPITM